MATKKRARSSPESAIVDVWRRELGQLSSRNFANRLAASKVYLLNSFTLIIRAISVCWFSIVLLIDMFMEIVCEVDCS